ncbi:MAG: hypothetical protein ACE5R6_21975, partial [Candidatus Heimdallarchaeota archaeon]
EGITLEEMALSALYAKQFKRLSTVDATIAAIATLRKMRLVSTDYAGFMPIREYMKHRTFFGHTMDIKLIDEVV